MRISRNTDFNKERNMTTIFNQRICGYMYDEELAGPNGMHFHVWVPQGTGMVELKRVAREISQKRDMVSMSYDFQTRSN